MLVILDNGHGGLSNGLYTTCPNYTEDSSSWHKMWVHKDLTLYEGVFNRRLAYAIAEKATGLNLEVQLLVPEATDISLSERVRRANQIYALRSDAFLLSLHGNAFNTSVKGFEIYTSKGETPSDPIATKIGMAIAEEFPGREMRWDLTDGDLDKEANFYMLSKTRCPAVLTENFFFDQYEDAKLMNSAEGIDRLANAYIKALLWKQQEENL